MYPKLTVDFGLGKLDKTRRQHLWHTTDSSRDHEETRASSLEDPNPERLGQRWVEENLSTREELWKATRQRRKQRESAIDSPLGHSHDGRLPIAPLDLEAELDACRASDLVPQSWVRLHLCE